MPVPVLQISGLRVAIDRPGGTVWPVDGVSLDAAAGECLCVVGESGSGKSMTALAVMGLLPPVARIESGTIAVNGRDVAALPAVELRRLRGREVGMVFQEPMTALDPLMTVGAQIAEAMTVHGVPGAEARPRTAALLAEAGIDDPARVAASYPHQLSGGLRQRVLIAGALANRPPLLLADEPTTALDVTVAAQILALLAGLRARLGMAVVLVTHDFGVVQEAADRAVVMYAGAVVERGPAAAVLASPRHPYTAALLAARPGREGTAPGARLAAIPGGVPDLAALPPGCRFEPRCPRAITRCAEEFPPETVEGDRGFRCVNPIDS